MRQRWTAGKVRSVFALRAEGKTLSEIATIMSTGGGQIWKILARRVHADVSINEQTLAKVALLAKAGNRKPNRKKRKLVKSPVNPAMPQAMKDADPQYSKPGDPPVNTLDGMTLGERPLPTPAQTVLTRAQALQSVLNHVELANEARALVKEQEYLLVKMRVDAKKLEDATFTLITELKERGFSQEFLSSFLDECGLCGDGLLAKV